MAMTMTSNRLIFSDGRQQGSEGIELQVSNSYLYRPGSGTNRWVMAAAGTHMATSRLRTDYWFVGGGSVKAGLRTSYYSAGFMYNYQYWDTSGASQIIPNNTWCDRYTTSL